MIKKLTFLLLFFLSTICMSQTTYNFESSSLTGWTQVPAAHWAASSASPLNGNYSLKHAISAGGITDRISIALPSWNPSNGTVTWQFKIRHGYDPSGSNRWWVFLMADEDANQMQIGGTGSGYAIGVNLTGTDDILKLWRIANGTPQAILASTLNWQTQITTSGIGAIEVERSKNGLFSLRASSSGLFSNLTNYGSITDNSYNYFSFFGICYNCTTSGDLKLWVDDISINFNPNDITSEVFNPINQIGSGDVSSTSNNSTSAVDVMKFQIKDNATSDILPTKVKMLDIKKGISADAANWVNSIGGVRLMGETEEVLILSQTISADKINLIVDSTTLTIPDGETKEYTLSVYLKPNNLVDGSTLRFMIDSTNHGFNAGPSGSNFVNTFSRSVNSNEFKIDIIATNLKVTQLPIGISKNSPFPLSIGGTDKSGNIDKEFSNDINLALTQGNGLLTSAFGLTKHPSLGISTWNDLQYNTNGTLKILATSAGINQVETNAINVLNDSTSVVSTGLSQPASVGISSLKTYPASAVEVLRFRINDIGETDGLATIVRNIKISRAEIADAASLTKAIGGVLVKVNGIPIGISEPDIKANYLTFTVSENNLVALDGGFIDVSVSIFLNETGLTDNQKIQLKIDVINHEFTTYPTGSKFNSTFPQQIISNIFWIDVVATQQKFSSIPTRVGVLQPFIISLNTTDLNGNTDKDFTGSVTLSRFIGNGILSFPSGSTMPIIQGSSIFNALTYSIPEKFALLASCTTLNNIASPLITCGDSDGGVSAITSSTNHISINSRSTTAQKAVEVLKLRVFDGGTTDGLPLIPTQIKLFCFDPTKTELLNLQIGGFVMKADNTNIDIESYSLTNGTFEIFPRAGSLIIADKDTVELSISIYLNKGNITDNLPFRFYIPSANHGWLSSSTGTGFANSFSNTIYGPESTVEVEATDLKFTKTPFSTIPSQIFPIQVSAVDTFGNIDIDFNDRLILNLYQGEGILSCSNINQNLTAGFAEWSDVSLDKAGVYRFKATGGLLSIALSDEIICGLDKDCLIQEEFEGVLYESWLGSNNWQLSTISPICGSKSLQHKQSANSGISTLAIPITFPTIGDKLIEWNFTLRNGDWNPSTDNYFYFALMASSSDLISDGYFVGVNPSSGSDYLTLWRNSQGVKIPVVKSIFDWSKNDEVKIKIGLNTRGEWKLWYKPKTLQSFVYGGTGKSHINAQMSWSGLVFGYTSSRSDQLWLDNLSICTTDYPPILLSANPLNLNTIKILFSERINSGDASSKDNYSINYKEGVSIRINGTSTSSDLPNEVYLKTEQLPFGELLLKVNSIKGLNGSSIKDSINFGLSEEGSLGRLVINEIMANPEPTVGLPNYEYIELYNPTSSTVHLDGWKIQLNDYKLSLPRDSLLPNQHIVLCSAIAASALSAFGKSIGVTGFPALLNSGMNIMLNDSNGALISMVKYSDSWYGDDTKMNGGWSLEKIDYQNLMEGKNNWKASTSSNGGTPCAVNSVAAANPDITPPRLLSAEVLTDTTIELLFSEPMDSLMLTFANNFDIDNGIGHPVSVTLIGTEYSTVITSLVNPFAVGTIYNLCLDQNLTDFSGNHLINSCVPLALPKTPIWNDIVINEVLFNPNTGGVDFVEIFNRSEKTFDLSNLSLANRNSTTNQLDGVNTASDTTRLLFPNDYAVITVNPELVKRYYVTENDKAFIRVSGMASFNNDEGHVVLLAKGLEIIDELSYKESMHSKLLNDFKGVSLERINPNLASSSIPTWQSAAQTVGFATPTYKNSQWVEPTAKDDAFTLSPETFSPDGDGRDDYLLITYKLPMDGCIANIRVFSSSGVEVKRLASNLLIGTAGVLTWDGLNSSNQKVPIGIYIVYIEYFNPNGEVKKHKKTCVVAEKM
ncbi:MAG: hypothetical protein EHM93_07195 [Bacteroidales bacterium]|nr:MAG: hypothetical protein EHM93_07195 [Bacteroidales bacterium]